VEKLARADRRLAASPEQFDADPWLLNTPAGTVDLRTGELRKHDHNDYCTKVTAVARGGECPRWRAFLKRVMGNDQELLQFVRRMAGYLLTGITNEHAFFFLYGQGANGKSVLVKTLMDLLGDYAINAPIETFLAAKFDRHPTEVARLYGARVVSAGEPDQGRIWKTSLIKVVTGGDKVTGRFMYKDFFDFVPQFKLVVAGNHKPSLMSVGEAMRRRLHLVPFNVTIRPGERDKSLADKLRDEWPGILAWSIEGCLEWQRQGLAPPPAVRAATDDYFGEEDTFGHWLEAYCVRKPGAWTSSADLYGSWAGFARDRGEESGTSKVFAQDLETRGYEPKRRPDARGFADIELRSAKESGASEAPRSGGC
jgi:putative DNA primase/helicase